MRAVALTSLPGEGTGERSLGEFINQLARRRICAICDSMKTLRTETRNGVGIITLTRADEYNTITPDLRDELAAAIDRPTPITTST